jgi:hypothetical protein
MPQLSLYIDDSTLSKLKKTARLKKVSVSKWVSEKLRSSFAEGWPEGYFDLFASVDDATFTRSRQPSLGDDVTRENL